MSIRHLDWNSLCVCKLVWKHILLLELENSVTLFVLSLRRDSFTERTRDGKVTVPQSSLTNFSCSLTHFCVVTHGAGLAVCDNVKGSQVLDAPSRAFNSSFYGSRKLTAVGKKSAPWQSLGPSFSKKYCLHRGCFYYEIFLALICC